MAIIQSVFKPFIKKNRHSRDLLRRRNQVYCTQNIMGKLLDSIHKYGTIYCTLLTLNLNQEKSRHNIAGIYTHILRHGCLFYYTTTYLGQSEPIYPVLKELFSDIT